MNDYYTSLEEVKQDFPDDVNCKFCGEENDFWDDIGFMYLFGEHQCCKQCWWGEPGNVHRMLYGVGER